MLDFLVRRLLATIPVLGMVALFVFFMLRLTPGDPAAILAGDNGEPYQIEAIREALGLNEPILTQLTIWLGNILQGDLGESFFFNKKVTELIAMRVDATLSASRWTCSQWTGRPLSPGVPRRILRGRSAGTSS